MKYIWEKYDYKEEKSALPTKVDEGSFDSDKEASAKRNITKVTNTSDWQKWENANTFLAVASDDYGYPKCIKRKDNFGQLARNLYYQYPRVVIYTES